MSDDTRYLPDDEDLSDVEALLRELSTEDSELITPPPAVWDRIQDEVALAPAVDEPELAPVVQLASRRRAPLLLTAAAAVVVLLVGIGLVVSDGSDSGEVVASAELAYDQSAFDPLGAEAMATARLVRSDDALRIELAESSLPAPSDQEDLEIWLLAVDDEGAVADLVSLGLVSADADSFEIPDAYDPDVFSVVDISVEPRDGDASHSGRSILRGALADA